MVDTFYGGGLGLGLAIASLVVVLVEIVCNVLVAVDAGRRPDWAFKGAGTDKSLWIGLPSGAAVLSLICCLCGGIFGVVAGLAFLIPAGLWMFSFRAKVEEAERRGPPYGGYGGPPPGYGPPPGFGGPGYGPPPGPPPGFGQGPPSW